VLLPVFVLVRRADTAAVVGAGLAAKAAGSGQRRIAALLGRPVETVRGWPRRFAARLESVGAVFTWWCRALAADPALPGPAGSAWADTLAAITATAATRTHVDPDGRPVRVSQVAGNLTTLRPGTTELPPRPAASNR
jgi:hypothetical protein